MSIVAFDIVSDDAVEIGKLEFLMIHLEHLIKSELHPDQIFDMHSEYLADHMVKIFDGDKEEFTSAILDYYDGDIPLYNICFIQNLQILPHYRGCGIGVKAIKDLVFHYGSGCGLFVIQPFPMQFETPGIRSENKALELARFADDEELAVYKLMAYFQRLGFELIRGIDEMLFYNPKFINEKLDEIDLEEEVKFKRV
jgi:GNAT superfamily N-acetyltransferase